MDTLRKIALAHYILTLWATTRTDDRGQTVLGYRLEAPDGATIFEGEDFCGSPLHADDSDETLAALLGFLTLRPGDTDREYFDAYTPAQLDFAESEGEYLGLLAEEHDWTELET
jgi:hypothetical protein